MHEKQVIILIVWGSGMIAMGLIPGLLGGLKEGLRNLDERLLGLPTARRSAAQPEWLPGQHWFAVAGIVLITLGLMALLTR